MISELNTRTMKVCPRCDYWHTLVNGFWRHVRPEAGCKYVETSRPATTAPREVWNAISQVLDSRACDSCGESYSIDLLDDLWICPTCHAQIDAVVRITEYHARPL
jgi:Zn finger protein HypA/HybF involved in hydrogenase expression